MVAQARRGDQAALERLLEENYPRIYAVCRRLTGHDADAADATQNAMISIVKGLPRFDGRSQFGTWVYRIAVNASIDELRRRSRRPVLALDGTEPMASLTTDALTRADDRTAHDQTADDRTATAVDVHEALLRLPVDFRAPVVLRDMCGLDYAEIADVLQIPAGTVRSRIARGRAALVELLGPARSES